MTPEEQISDISRRKLTASLDLLPLPRPKAIVLSADTEVVFAGKLLGKPKDHRAALETLNSLNGRVHEVITAVSLFETVTGKTFSLWDSTIVEFTKIPDLDLEAYVKTGDPLDKAGSYGIQNIPNSFVRSLRGSRSNVIGLPVEKILSFFQEQKWTFK